MLGIGTTYSNPNFGAYKRVNGKIGKRVLDVRESAPDITKHSRIRNINTIMEDFNKIQKLYLKKFRNHQFTQKGGTELP